MWSIKDGTIICTGKPNGYIVTEKEYGDYILKLWRLPADSKGATAACCFTSPVQDKVWPNSVEAQLAAGQAGDFWLIADDKNQLRS